MVCCLIDYLKVCVQFFLRIRGFYCCFCHLFLCPDPSVTNVKEETALHTAMQSDGEDEDICKIVSRLLTDRYITRRCIIMGN